jgi:hypothetical protein
MAAAMEPAAMEAAAMEAAAVEAAAMESAAMESATVIAGAPVDPAIPSIPSIAAIIAAVPGVAAIAAIAAIIAAAVTGIDAGFITTGKRDRERRDDCTQKNSTANHGLSSFAYLTPPLPASSAHTR